MNHFWSTSIDKLMIWKNNAWTKYELRPGSLHLRSYYDQLFIASETKVLESFNMNQKLKGIYKKDILILIVSITGQEMKKIKFQIKNNVPLCLQKLGEHFPVISHNAVSSKNCLQPKYRNIDDALKVALSQEGIACLPPIQDLNNFVKLCLLDPTFPQIVGEVENILQNKL